MTLAVAASIVVAGVAVAGIAAVAWCSSLRDKARALDATIDALLDSDTDDEPEADETDVDGADGDPDPPRDAWTPEQVLAMSKGQISALCRVLDETTDWCIHPSLLRRPRPVRRCDPFDFFTDGGMS